MGWFAGVTWSVSNSAPRHARETTSDLPAPAWKIASVQPHNQSKMPSDATADGRVTLRECVMDQLRAFKMTTVFGNPGSTELGMLDKWPEDIDYVLGLQEVTFCAVAHLSLYE